MMMIIIIIINSENNEAIWFGSAKSDFVLLIVYVRWEILQSPYVGTHILGGRTTSLTGYTIGINSNRCATRIYYSTTPQTTTSLLSSWIFIVKLTESKWGYKKEPKTTIPDIEW